MMHEGITHTSIALICGFLILFIFFVYLSSKPPRISDPVRASSSRPKRNKPKRHKPELWNVCLDIDPYHEFNPPDEAMSNWSPLLCASACNSLRLVAPSLAYNSTCRLFRRTQPLTAWTNDNQTSDDLRQSHPYPEVMMRPHVAIAQAWFRGAYSFYPRAERSTASQFPVPPAAHERPHPDSDLRMLNVAILVTMPFRRKLAPIISESAPHPAIGFGLSYNEGQLEMGVTSLPCKEQAIHDALRQQERTTERIDVL